MIGIIGGLGFLGTRLSERLNKSGINFVSGDIKSKDNNHVNIDIEDENSLSKFSEVDWLINLAAIHRDDVRPVSRYDDVNVQGSINLCNAARAHNIKKIIFTSSVAIYGFAPADTDESGKANYFNDYGRTKHKAEQIYIEWQEEDPNNRTLVIIRPTVIFGEGNRGNVYNLLNQIASKRFVMIGNGKNKKSMAYVENVAAFIEYCLSLKAGKHIYNYIDKPDFDMNSLVSEARYILFNKKNIGLRLPALIANLIGMLADLLIKFTGKNIPVSSIRIKKFMGTTQFKSSVKKTGFVAPLTLQEGLERTLRYEFLEDNSDKKTFDTE